MLPVINFFGKDISTYGIMALLGLFFSSVFLFIRKSNNIEKEDIIYSTLYALIFFLFGGKLLYIIITFFQIKDLHMLSFGLILDLLKGGGYVWYGAFYGALLGYYVYCKQYNIRFPMILENTIFVIPLGHFFGRIGCFCVGCCYGISFPEPLGVYFKENSHAPHNTPLLPVQLFEAIFNLLLFFIIWILSKKPNRKYTLYSVYAFSYGIFRFFIEFLRYDHNRGFFMFLSTSQWLSVVLFITGVISLKKTKKLPK